MRAWLLTDASVTLDGAALIASGADAILLDLGACNDGDGRQAARARAAAFLSTYRDAPGRPALHVRIAPLDSREIDADLAALMPYGLDGVLLENSLGAPSVRHLCAKLAVWEAEAGLADGATRIIAQAAQTPAGVFGLGGYAGASQRLEALVYDGPALAAALGLPSDPEPRTLGAARALLVLGAAAAGVAAIDGTQGSDGAEPAIRYRAARREGFHGIITATVADLPTIAEIFQS